VFFDDISSTDEDSPCPWRHEVKKKAVPTCALAILPRRSSQQLMACGGSWKII